MACMIAFTNMGCHAQSNVDDKQAMTMLKHFYTIYNTEWATNHDLNKRHVLDSLMNIYCTSSLISKISEPNLDHDMLIKDLYTTVEYLNTITVSKDSTKAGTYIVTYNAPNEDPQGREYIEKVTIHVTVIKEGDSYKIADVK